MNIDICDKVIVVPFVFQYVYQKYCYFVTHVKKMLRHTNGIIQNVQLTTHQPPIPKTSQAAAWSHRYNGD